MHDRHAETIGSRAWCEVVDRIGCAKLSEMLGVSARTVDNWAKCISRPPIPRRVQIRKLGYRNLRAVIEPDAWGVPVGWKV